jgi:hypothetical protein
MKHILLPSLCVGVVPFFVSLGNTNSFLHRPVTVRTYNRCWVERSTRRERLTNDETTREEFELESELLQAELNALTSAEMPMFASFDASNIDQSALPLPAFTATIIFLGSLLGTYYLYDVGLNGVPVT